jgi:hypothetical protein
MPKQLNIFYVSVAVLVLLISGCSSTPKFDANFGESLKASKNAMRQEIHNENTKPSHVEMINPLERYQQQDAASIATPMTGK